MSTFLEVLVWVGTGALMLLGLVGSVAPALPGPPLVFAGALLYALANLFAPVGWVVIAALAALAAFSQLMDYLASAWGAKKFGGGKWGVLGSLLGGIAGFLFFGFFGMIAGIFVGAVGLELVFGDKEVRAALRVGGGSLVGFLAGALMKVVISLCMIGIFLFDALR